MRIALKYLFPNLKEKAREKMKCILIETNDKRKFLTYEKNLNELKNFIDIFQVKITKVDQIKGKILDLKDLAVALCEVSNKKDDVEYKPINQKDNKKITSSKKSCTLIRSFIYNNLIKNKPVSVKDLKQKFNHFDLCDATFYNHIRKVKEVLEKQGIEVKKISPGNFKANSK